MSGVVVEIDGGYHCLARMRGDRVLVAAGYRVLRLEAKLVVRELPVALERVRETLEQR